MEHRSPSFYGSRVLVLLYVPVFVMLLFYLLSTLSFYKMGMHGYFVSSNSHRGLDNVTSAIWVLWGPDRTCYYHSISTRLVLKAWDILGEVPIQNLALMASHPLAL